MTLFYIDSVTRTIKGWIDRNNNAYIIVGQTPINDSKWHHVAIGWNNHTRNITLYVDGNYDTSVVMPVSTNNIKYNGNYGFTNQGADINKEIFISDLKLFNTTLNKTEINELYPYNTLLNNFTFLNNTIIYGDTNITYNINITNITASFLWNGTTQYILIDHYNTSSTNYVFETTFNLPVQSNLQTQEIISSWNITYFILNDYLILEEQINITQTLYNGIRFGNCSQLTNLTITTINLTYYDEYNDYTPITTNIAYDISITNGYSIYELEGGFTNGTSDGICTNIDNTTTPLDWDIYGTFTATKDNYGINTYIYKETSPLNINNTSPTYLQFFLSPLNETTTIKYNWVDTNYNLINGIMHIYKCNNDGTKTLLANTIISDGIAYGNIQYNTQAYAYSVTVGSTTHSESSYNTCHAEYNTEITYYVTLTTTTIPEYIGFITKECTITQTNTTTAKIDWEINDEDETSSQACIIGVTLSNTGQTKVMESCTNSTIGGTYSANITGSPSYIVGVLTQGSKLMQCKGYIILGQDALDNPNNLGNMGILSIFMILLSIGLLLSENGTVRIFGIILTLGGCILAGFTNFGWEIGISASIFLIIIVLITRYTKKKNG